MSQLKDFNNPNLQLIHYIEIMKGNQHWIIQIDEMNIL